MSRANTGVILKPYRKTDSLRRRVLKWALIPTLALFCLVYGFLFGVLAPFGLIIVPIPLMIMAAFAIWALPEYPTAPTGALAALFWALLVVICLWPNYLAIALPGLPWITLIRLVGGPLSFVLLVCVSTSREFRSAIAKPLAASGPVGPIFLAFIVVQFLSVFFSQQKFYSAEKFIVQQMTWTAVFFAGLYFFSSFQRAQRFLYVLWGMGVVVSLIACAEAKMGHVLWVGHIPSFLKVSDETVARILQGTFRAATGIYRAQGVFTTPLALAEFLVCMVPFLVHFAVKGRFVLRALALASIGLYLFAILQTNARLGVVGFGLSLIFYGLFWAAFRWLRVRESIFAPAIFVGSPVLVLFVAAAVLRFHALRVRVIGGGAEQASTEARSVQWHMGMPKILSHPWGYGDGRAADVLGFYQPGGLLTIDSGYLQVLLDYGVVGFVLFYAMPIVLVFKALGRMIADRAGSREAGLLLPSVIMLLNYLVIRSIYSVEENETLVFVFFSFITALIYRVSVAQAGGEVEAPTSTVAVAARGARLGAA